MVEIEGPRVERADEVLTPGALELVEALHRELDSTRRELLAGLPRLEGQGVITTTELGAVPGSEDRDVAVVEVADGTATAARERARASA